MNDPRKWRARSRIQTLSEDELNAAATEWSLRHRNGVPLWYKLWRLLGKDVLKTVAAAALFALLVFLLKLHEAYPRIPEAKTVASWNDAIRKVDEHVAAERDSQEKDDKRYESLSSETRDIKNAISEMRPQLAWLYAKERDREMAATRSGVVARPGERLARNGAGSK